MGWSKNIAKIWPNFLPPARPSESEIRILTKYLRKIQKKLNRKVELLILGSTGEFRDWGFEQFLNITVIDCNIDYYKTSRISTKYKYSREKFAYKKWQEMDFENQFDIIVGDIVIGNLKKEEIDNFLKRTAKALTKDGFFFTKSIFKDNKKRKSLEKIFQNYYSKYKYYHPYTKNIYDILLSCIEKDEDYLDYRKAYNKIYNVYKTGLIKKDILDIFSRLRWHDLHTYKLYMPTFNHWEKLILKYFSHFKKEYGEDIYSRDIPVYIIYKNK